MCNAVRAHTHIAHPQNQAETLQWDGVEETKRLRWRSCIRDNPSDNDQLPNDQLPRGSEGSEDIFVFLMRFLPSEAPGTPEASHTAEQVGFSDVSQIAAQQVFQGVSVHRLVSLCFGHCPFVSCDWHLEQWIWRYRYYMASAAIEGLRLVTRTVGSLEARVLPESVWAVGPVGKRNGSGNASSIAERLGKGGGNLPLLAWHNMTSVTWHNLMMCENVTCMAHHDLDCMRQP